MFIQTETTPNPDAIKFIPGVKVMKNGTTKEFLSGDDTRSSPLARSLLSVPGVKSIFFGPDFISINKDPEENWSTTKPEIFSLLMEFFSSAGNHDILIDSQSSSPGGPIDTRINDDDDEVVGMIKELLDTRVRPAIQEDGGDLEYKGFDEQTGVVSLMLKGSCRGCDSSSVTLKNGIERMLMHYIPEVQSVEQVESEEEKVSKDEFEKFEARLRAGGKTVDI
ncbi:scaffold protein Nfu/NifU N terminal-domain-containing protein [Phakopsora pachyrhizi]|uniref:Scaffold protein Nfu/NifU N terminal-domain-containing protein n=1 Tax=Phakopsora pachyrhizi TaxID=170000 RepID=A0AAV0AYH9_PHAPC|nr:scaffold protein Nfu/NifU N terminal-domain-containing protein [Phakopsora pachyrhizi]CAH7674496.1 scaffold protein Nfu/NifU N terminal-domain-containing protein [Phakopsora pachyrhizi]